MPKLKKVKPYNGFDSSLVDLVHDSRILSDEISYAVVRSADEPCISDEVFLTTSVRSLAFAYLKQLRDVNNDKSYAVIITRRTRSLCY